MLRLRRERRRALSVRLLGSPYPLYQMSPHWASVRRAALERAGYRCESCGSHRQLQAHLLNYERLGMERPEDLRVLCGECQIEFHATHGAPDMPFERILTLDDVVRPGLPQMARAEVALSCVALTFIFGFIGAATWALVLVL